MKFIEFFSLKSIFVTKFIQLAIISANEREIYHQFFPWSEIKFPKSVVWFNEIVRIFFAKQINEYFIPTGKYETIEWK